MVGEALGFKVGEVSMVTVVGSGASLDSWTGLTTILMALKFCSRGPPFVSYTITLKVSVAVNDDILISPVT